MHPDFVFFSSSADEVILGTKDRYNFRKVPVLFKCGAYPDKQFSLSPDEAAAAIADFKNPVPVDLEHRPSVFDGKLGQLVSVELNPDKVTFSGVYAIPEWVEKVLPPDKRKVSISFDRKSKKIRGLSLVKNPRIEEANFNNDMLASFMDDAKMGGLPPPPPIPGDIPDTPSTGKGKGGVVHGPDLFKQICELAQKALADAEGNTVFSKEYTKALTDICKIAEKNGGGGKKDKKKDADADSDATGTSGSDTTGFNTDTPSTPTGTEPTEREKALTAQLEKERKDRIQSEAVAFAKDAIEVQHRATSAERDSLVALYIQAANQDVVTFSQGGTPSMVETLKKSIEMRPKNQYTQEILRANGDGTTVLPAEARSEFSKDSGISPERWAQLLGQTEMGRARLRELADQYASNRAKNRN